MVITKGNLNDVKTRLPFGDDFQSEAEKSEDSAQQILTEATLAASFLIEKRDGEFEASSISGVIFLACSLGYNLQVLKIKLS
jgi:hypothetical protein